MQIIHQDDAFKQEKCGFQVGCSKSVYTSDAKNARIQLIKLLIFNTLYRKISF